MTIKVSLRDGAKNVEQIEDYWFRRERALIARSAQSLARADFLYLIETGREDEAILAHLMEKPVAWASYQLSSMKARTEDGDHTLHTRIYPSRGRT